MRQPDEERTPRCLDIFRKTKKKPMKTFSNVEFVNCRCHLILTTVYTQMLQHCHGIGKKKLILTAILEFAEVCLMNYNIPQARRLLSEAEILLRDQMFETSEEELIIRPYLTAKIQILQGRYYLESGIISEAKRKMDEAMNTLGYNFPISKFMIDLKIVAKFELLRWKLTCPKGKVDDTVDEHITNYMEQLANCLALMFDVFKIKGMKTHARLAATWSLNVVLESSQDFFTLCTSFTNMIIIAQIYQTRSIISHLENNALSFCAEKEDTLELQELKAVAELYARVFFSRWLRGEIDKATEIGFITNRMAQTMDSVFLKLLVLPTLAHLLMISCRNSEVVALLRELEFASESDLDKSGRTWYYAICVDMQLDTGLTILSFQSCERYYLEEGEAMISLRDPEAERRYFTSMWLWCVRTQQWEASKIWGSRNVTTESVMDEHLVAATITALKKLEGLLILYVREASCRSIHAINIMSEVKDILKRVEKVIKIVRVAIPRYVLLKAYYYMIQSQRGVAMKMLRQTKKLSRKMNNKMIYAWAHHCQQVWLGIVSPIQENLWREKIVVNDEWNEINATDSTIIPFAFPLPK